MKLSKRIISGLLTLAMSFSLVSPLYANAIGDRDNDGTKMMSSDNKDILNADTTEIKSTNSLGAYFKKIQDKQEMEQNEVNLYYSVISVELNESRNQIKVVTTQNSDCTLKVSILNDDTDKVQKEYCKDLIKGDHTETVIDIGSDILPEYFKMEAVITGLFGKELSIVKPVNDYTRAFCELQRTDINDFDEETVINLDDDDKTNFVVVSDDTVLAESDNNKNILVCADYDNGVFKFENADETILGLQKDDYFCIKPNDTDLIAINVESVDTENGITTLTDSGKDIDDMFSFIKIEAHSNSYRRPPVANGLYADGSDLTSIINDFIETNTLSFSAEISNEELSLHSGFDLFDENVKLNAENLSKIRKTKYGYEATIDEDPFVSFDFDACFGLKAEFDFDIDFYKSWFLNAGVSINITIDTTFGLSASEVSISKEFGIELGELPLGATGIVLSWTPRIEISISGSVAFEYEKIYTFELDANTDGDVYRNSTEQTIAAQEPYIEVSISLTLYLLPDICILSKYFIETTFDVGFKVEFTVHIPLTSDWKFEYGKPEIEKKNSDGSIFILNNTTGQDEVKHVCENYCIAFDIKTSIEIGFSVSIFTIEIVSVDLFSIPLRTRTGYLSEAGFDWGDDVKCPNDAYRVEIIVREVKNGRKSVVQNADVVAMVNSSIISQKTDYNGRAVFYCKNEHEIYKFSVIHNSTTKSKSHFIHNAERIIFEFDVIEPDTTETTSTTSASQDPIIETKEPEVTTKSTNDKYDMYTIESVGEKNFFPSELACGQLAENICYSITKDDDGFGEMNIFGYGSMDDDIYKKNVSSARSKISKFNVKTVYITNENEENAITSIGKGLFSGCSTIEEITVPYTIELIEAEAFKNCTSLNKIKVSMSTEKEVVYDDFSKCNVAEIGVNAFTNTGFSEIKLPDTLKKIGNACFLNCKFLTEISVPDSVTVIDNFAFSSCENLKKADIGLGISTLYDSASNDESYRYIGYNIFSNCTLLTEVSLPVFNGRVSNLYDNHNRYACPFEILNIKGEPTEIPSYFCESLSIKNASLPDSLIKIGSFAFYECKNITEVKFPSKLEIIGNGSFGYTSISEVVIPDNVTVIENGAFISCANLKKAEIGMGINKIYGVATVSDYKGNTNMIGVNVFNNCPLLTEISLPVVTGCLSELYNDRNRYSCPFEIIHLKGEPEEIPRYFCRSLKIKSINFPDSLKVIHAFAFEECKNLTEIELPSGLEIIGNGSFNNTGLSDIVIPDSVVVIENGAFSSCANLKKADIGMGIKIEKSIASSSEYGGNSNMIGINVFNGCTQLTELSLPAYSGLLSDLYNTRNSSDCPFEIINIKGSPDTICKKFANFKALKTISIPETVTLVDSYAFNSCEDLETVYYSGSDEQWEAITIKDHNDPLINAKKIKGEVSSEFMYGDLNFDGTADLTDLTFLSLYLLKDKTFDETQLRAADIDGNGDVDIADLARFKQYVCHDMAVPYIYKLDSRYTSV